MIRNTSLLDYVDIQYLNSKKTEIEYSFYSSNFMFYSSEMQKKKTNFLIKSPSYFYMIVKDNEF